MVDADVIVIGAGLSGLVTATEAVARGRTVIVLDAEPTASLGGQAWWPFGGLFMVGSPEQRRLGVRDSAQLAFEDWLGSARFAPGADQGKGPDRYGYAWAQRYVEFAAGPMREWLHRLSVRWFPLVQWAERGGYPSGEHGNSVPRFHVTWGTGPAIVAPFISAANAARTAGKLEFRFRHRAIELMRTNGAVTGVRAQVLAASTVARGEPSSREVTAEVDLTAESVVIAAGGIGANHDLVRELWPHGQLPATMLSGVPDSTDGSMQSVATRAGAELVHTDRMWHYPEGLPMHTPVWQRHGIRILPGPSSLWLDADGHRLPAPLYPGFDALGALEHITARGDEHSWFVLNRAIMETEFALSGSDQNPDLTGKDVKLLLKRVTPGAVGPVAHFARQSAEFVWARTPAQLAAGMNELTGQERVDPAELTGIIRRRDRQVSSGLGKDPQVVATAAARSFWVDKHMRVSPPRPLITPADGPLLAVRLHVLTRKTLGGIHTDTNARVLDTGGAVIEGLYAVGEAAGFGGGGVHGHRALEGTFLGGCLLTARVAAAQV